MFLEGERFSEGLEMNRRLFLLGFLICLYGEMDCFGEEGTRTASIVRDLDCVQRSEI